MKNKAIKIAESFLRPARSFGQTQRFIAESDIPKMMGQICDQSGGVSEKLKDVADNYAKYGPPEARQINSTKRNAFMHGALWNKNHGQSHPTPEMSEGDEFGPVDLTDVKPDKVSKGLKPVRIDEIDRKEFNTIVGYLEGKYTDLGKKKRNKVTDDSPKQILQMINTIKRILALTNNQ